jgi:serine/threonine protein kinase/tetratricopeptide (TPR) repeat protein
MPPQRWDQVKEKLQIALEMQPEQRAAYLSEVGKTDPELLQELKSLLESEKQAGTDFLKTHALRPIAAGVLNQSGNLIGRSLGPYEIRELIGAGGMGEVYRAHDPRLGRDVAIKVLPVLLATNSDRLRRFEQEARAAAALNHPNILAIHDLGETGDIHYVVSELLEGETLRARLREDSLSIDHAIRLLLQIAQGLGAAHAKGIVHRDLKPENIFLTTDGNPKILDFGLAKLLSPTDITRKQSADQGDETATGLVMGTPGYMSPEQVRGKPVDQRTDIFALGAIAYEMLSGRRAFHGESAADTISAILSHVPPPLSSPQRSIPTALDRVVHRCLEKAPGDRFQSVREFSSALETITESGFQRDFAAGSWLRPDVRRWVLPFALLVLTAAALVAGYQRWYRKGRVTESRSATVSTSAMKPRKTVAVLGFKDLSARPESSWLSPALAEMLTTELAAGQQLRMVPGENVARAKNDLALAETDSLAQDTLLRIRKNLGNDFVVLGSYLDLGKDSGGQIRLDLHIQDATSGETLASFAENGTETGLLDLVSRAGTELRAKLGAGTVSSDEVAQVKASLPANPDAARYYAEGLTKMRSFDNLGARDSLQKAVLAEPDFALEHAALAEAWAALGYDAKSAEEAKQAFDLSSNLPREQHLVIEGRYHEANKNWAKAVDVYHTLWTFAPDNLDYGLRLAITEASAGQAKDALVTVDALRNMPPPASEDPRIDLAESQAAFALSDFKRALAAAKKAGQKGQAQGARLLLAQAKMAETRALFSLGDTKESQHTAEEAHRLFAEAGDRNGEATALHNKAAAISEQGDNAGALQLHKQALEVCRTIGNRRCMSDALNSIGVIYKDEGNFVPARQAYEQSLALRREVGDRIGEAVGLNNIGVLYYQQGKPDAARKMYEQALGISREIGQKRGIVRALTNLGIVLKDQGELAQSRKVQEESLTIRRGIGDKTGTGIALNNLAEVLFVQGDLATAQKYADEQADLDQQTGNQRGLAYARFLQGRLFVAEGKLAEARKSQEEALAMRTKMGEKTTTEDSRLALGIVSIEEGHPADAETPAREIRDQANAGKEPLVEITAETVLARALLALGKPAEAGVEINKAEQLTRSSVDRLQQIDVGIISARIRSAIKASADQTRRLAALVAQAKKYGCTACEFEARLALGELELRSGHTPSGRAHLAQLEKDSAAKGFLLIAGKARAISAPN